MTHPRITKKDRAAWLCTLPLDYETTKREMKMAWDSGDLWGSCMGALFPLASELWFRDPGIVPAEWLYSPGAISYDDPREKEDYLFDVYRVADTDALLKLGDLLHRFADYCKRKGLDY